MSTLREAIQHARAGGTARFGGKEVRFLTFEEAEPIIFELTPTRVTRIDEKTGKPVIENGEIVVDTFAEPNFDTKRLGLYDVGTHPAEPLRVTDDDIYLPVELDEEGKEKPRVLRTDWELLSDEKPEAVAPETVDEVFAEEHPAE
jgi:hypothetical protein